MADISYMARPNNTFDDHEYAVEINMGVDDGGNWLVLSYKSKYHSLRVQRMNIV